MGYRKDCYEHHKKTDDQGEHLVCHLCQERIDPVREKWDAEHIVPRTLGGSDAPENVFPAHAACHRPKTANDITANAKAKRLRDKHTGVIRPKGFWKPYGYRYKWGQR